MSNIVDTLKLGRDALAEAMNLHIYDAANGETPGPKCRYQAAVLALDSAVTPPVKSRDRQFYTPLEMEAALCAWEFLLDHENLPEEKRVPAIAGAFGSMGYAAMRHVSMQAGAIALAVHDHMETNDYEHDGGSYDWDFVPSVLVKLDWLHLVQDNQYSGEPYRPDIPTLFELVLADLGDQITKRDRAAEWMAKARRECHKQWGYAELIDDHEERTRVAFEAKQDPAEFVRLLGEKYDLEPAGLAW
ncbi:hypothetical protein [Mesorhizobium sp. ANAO-SY3R2]|uniref:hypothetical protein n=1 Tax=Mesorhizobium sp. ANAO-SY3R2 TaxID=3166644 RepID=UPI0036726DCD